MLRGPEFSDADGISLLVAKSLSGQFWGPRGPLVAAQQNAGLVLAKSAQGRGAFAAFCSFAVLVFRSLLLLLASPTR